MKLLPWKDVERFIKHSENSKDVFFVFFTVENNQICKIMKRIMYSVENKYKDRQDILFYEVNAIESGLYMQPGTEYQLLEVPTFCVIQNNKIKYLGHNFYPEEILVDWIVEVCE
ncbi:YbbN family protein [Mycoplasmopsis felifaucium]|uniref:hypothetical protein n=1 Tax=Mycoplasmopsis felifaucium TaxID=35768 RepID=UPI000486991E|nr:hypothetical protein [Mycoplasmopsis felifaucium]